MSSRALYLGSCVPNCKKAVIKCEIICIFDVELDQAVRPTRSN